MTQLKLLSKQQWLLKEILKYSCIGLASISKYNLYQLQIIKTYVESLNKSLELVNNLLEKGDE